MTSTAQIVTIILTALTPIIATLAKTTITDTITKNARTVTKGKLIEADTKASNPPYNP